MIEDYLSKYESWIVVIFVMIISLFILFIVISITSWIRGDDIKVLWFEIKNNKKRNDMNENELSKTIINAKNVNTGINHGTIGDTYNGIQQRHLTEIDKKQLLTELNNFQNKYSQRINNDHITIGYPGDKESRTFANEVANFINSQGYQNTQLSILVTYGSTGRKFSVSNAPDDSVMIEIFPADNV